MRLGVLLIGCLFAAVGLSAQRFDFDFFTVDEGLSDRQITEMYLGEQGFLWVGTRDGLNRFDGYNFIPFGQGPFSEAGLSLGNIAQIGRDLEGNIILFYQDFNGYFDRFDPKDFSIEQVELTPGTGVTGFPRALATDELGRIFVVMVTKKETLLYEYTSVGFVSIARLDDPRETIAPAVSLLPLTNGQFLLYDGQYGLRRLSATGELINTVDLEALDARPLYGEERFERLEFICQGPEGKVYFAFYGHRGLYYFDPTEQEATPHYVADLPSNLYFSRADADQLGQLLFFARTSSEENDQVNRFFLLNEEGQFINYDELTRVGSRISCAAAHDFREKIFLGLYDGLGIVERRSANLRNFLAVDQEEEYFQQLIRGITEDRSGLIYFTEENGQLYRLDPTTDQLDSLYLHLPADDGDLLEIERVNQLLYDVSTHSIWGCGQSLGGERAGILYRYDISACTTEAYYYSGGAFQCMAKDESGRIYLGSGGANASGQLLYYDEAASVFMPVVDAGGQPMVKNTVPIYLSVSKNDGRLLVGTRGKGLLIIDTDKKRCIHFAPTPWKEEKLVFNDYTINVIHENPDGSLYLGTRGGLHYFDVRANELKHFGRPDGLSSNIISSILPDEEGNFWVSTYNGLTYYQPEGTPNFRRYYRTDGLSNDEFNRYSAYRATDGRFYFGGVNGLTTFYPRELQQEESAPPVLISQVTIYGLEERQLRAGIDEEREVVINKDEKGIAVQFALPARVATKQNRFRVRLEGLNKDWVELGDEHVVRYNNLKAGRYYLHAQATDANGSYTGEEVVLPIRVYQHFYEQGWFPILVGLVIVGFIIGILQSRSRERLQNEKLRTQLSSDIHDEVSGLLAGITMQTELLQGYTEDEHIKTRLKGVGEAGRKAMSKMSDVIWSVDSRRDTVGDLLQRMQEHADDVLLPLEIKYTFRAEGLDEKSRKITGNKRQDIYFIYKEVINNIARHSNASKVNVYLGVTGQEFEMIIRDNGEATNGFDARKSAKTGQGLANLRMRAQRLNAELTVNEKGDKAMHLRMRKV